METTYRHTFMTDVQPPAESHREDLSGFFQDLRATVDGALGTHKADLTGFFAGIDSAVSIARRAQAELDRTAATRFSLFPYFNTGELDLSRIFGDLLDPRGTHGQGDTFLRAFLEQTPELGHFRQCSDLTACQVHLELLTTTLDDARRIDIVLEMPGSLWIGIENKPWAVDQEHQVRDYLNDLRARGHESARLLYLSGDGTVPKEYPDLECDEQRQCVTVPYCGPQEKPSVANWIERCIARCQAERVHWFLRELLRFIQRAFDYAS